MKGKKMTKQSAIEYMSKHGHKPDGGCKITFKVIDHSANVLAPEKTCYKLYYTCRGIKVKFALWPNTVGFQQF